MSNIIDIGGFAGVGSRSPVSESPSTAARNQRRGAAPDITNLSNSDRASLEEARASSLRQARLQAIRVEIAEGRYETPERIAGTVRRLIDIIA